MNSPVIEWLRPADGSALADLIRPGEVHSRVYTDPNLFELEMTRIFATTWLFIGHESEIPNPGDFKLRWMGKAQVIFVRGHDRVIRVLMNRCRHRGAEVCEFESGNTRVFACPYHAWSFDTTGKLLGVPQPEAYETSLVGKGLDLTAAPRVDSYRGFVFASLAAEGQTLTECLGPASGHLDIAIDSSPTGELFVDAGQQRTRYRGNWKLVGMDGYHPNYLHASVVASWQRNQTAGLGATHRDDPYKDNPRSSTLDLGNGHVALYLLEHRLPAYEKHCAHLRSMKGGDKYIEDMHKKHGEKRARELISSGGDPHMAIFPNLQILSTQLRVINPFAVDNTEQIALAYRLGGVDDAINIDRLRQQESFYGPCGAGAPDDSEVFERVQRGMHAELNPWLNVSRGLHRQKVRPDGILAGQITDEVPQRAQMNRWLELMVKES